MLAPLGEEDVVLARELLQCGRNLVSGLEKHQYPVL